MTTENTKNKVYLKPREGIVLYYTNTQARNARTLRRNDHTHPHTQIHKRMPTVYSSRTTHASPRHAILTRAHAVLTFTHHHAAPRHMRDTWTLRPYTTSFHILKRHRENFLQIENEREFNDALIQDRDEGIKQIESTIIEVNGIFTDLAQIVHEQGFMIGKE